MIDSAQILYEDNHLLVLNKRSGQITQSDKTGDICMADEIRDFIRVRDDKPGNVFCGVVHRLDRPVSGVVIFAKTSKATTRLNNMIRTREVQKTYWALTKGVPPAPQGHLENWLLRNEKQNKSFVVAEGTPMAKFASLDYRLLATSEGGYSLIEVDLHTGRHHQIRCQLAHIGCVIKGDLKYGASRSNPDGSISLHARRINLIHPVRKEPLEIVAPLPDDALWQSFDGVGGNNQSSASVQE